MAVSSGTLPDKKQHEGTIVLDLIQRGEYYINECLPNLYYFPEDLIAHLDETIDVSAYEDDNQLSEDFSSLPNDERQESICKALKELVPSVDLTSHVEEYFASYEENS